MTRNLAADAVVACTSALNVQLSANCCWPELLVIHLETHVPCWLQPVCAFVCLVKALPGEQHRVVLEMLSRRYLGPLAQISIRPTLHIVHVSVVWSAGL